MRRRTHSSAPSAPGRATAPRAGSPSGAPRRGGSVPGGVRSGGGQEPFDGRRAALLTACIALLYALALTVALFSGWDMATARASLPVAVVPLVAASVTLATPGHFGVTLKELTAALAATLVLAVVTNAVLWRISGTRELNVTKGHTFSHEAGMAEDDTAVLSLPVPDSRATLRLTLAADETHPASGSPCVPLGKVTVSGEDLTGPVDHDLQDRFTVSLPLRQPLGNRLRVEITTRFAAENCSVSLRLTKSVLSD